ncbi:MAG: hypothetical protein VYC96_08800 [Actinomycetota bacterium]|nr:hypothetical protein [Actinomycetota bacterium]
MTCDESAVTLGATEEEEEDEMSGQHDGRSPDDRSTEIPEADALEQGRDAVEQPEDPERTITEPLPEGVEADPADVIEQSIDVPVDDDDREEEA